MFILSFLFFLSSFLFLAATPAAAQCPVCVITVGGGMLIAEKLGVDDLLVSIWISALNTAVTFWLAPKIKIKFLNNGYISAILLLVFTLAYFQVSNQMNTKVLSGQILGLIAMFVGNYLYSFTKSKNGDKALFPYSKVIFPVGLVLLVTLFMKLAFHL